MKANSRRRVLISSLAMLLVAIVALGTATYAWFTSSTVATANGINVKTIQASELQISSATSGWDTTVDYGVSNKVLLPASTGDGSNWFTASAAEKTAMNAEPGTPAPVNKADTYYFVDQLNVRNNGTADIEDIEITFNVTNDYLRVALVPATAKGTGKAFVSGTDFTKCVFDNAGTLYNAASGIEMKTFGEGEDAKQLGVFTTTEITPSNTGKVTIDKLAGKAVGAETGEAVYYNLYVWFEGQDAQCIDSNAGAVIEDIVFTVSGTTADQITTQG